MNGPRLQRVRAGIGIGFAILLVWPSSVAAGPRPSTSVSTQTRAVLAAPETTSWIVTVNRGVDARRDAPGLAKAVGGTSGRAFGHALHGFVFKGSAKAAAALLKNRSVRSVVPDGTFHVLDGEVQTGVARIGANNETAAPSAYEAGFTGAGVRVAILDTGIDLTHPDLVPNLDTALGQNCMTAGPPQDGHGHGTHVAGIVAAAVNGLGVVGVAPEARLVPFKVLNDAGSGEWSNLICAIDIITGYATDADPSNDIRVANMSLGDVGTIGTCTDGGVREAICTSVAAGVTYVAAAGNSTVDASTFIPAAFPEVIAVSALTDLDGKPGGLAPCWLYIWFCDDTLAEFSNYGATIDVAAPGTQIYSDWTGGGYATEMGTSMASPHVAGVAALLLAAFPSLAPADVEERLKASGECPDGQLADADGGSDCAGKGQWGNDPDGIAEPLVNALNAVQGGNPGDLRPSVAITSPVDGSSVSGPIVVTANATDDVGVSRVEFQVNGVLRSTDTDGSDGWSMPWDASAVDGGAYTFTATAFDTAGQQRSHSISVRAGTNAQGSWVGTYGHDGYVIADWYGSNIDLASLPAGVSFAMDQGARFIWASPTTDVRGLQSPTSTERRATTWYDDQGSLQLHLTFANGYHGNLHLYAVDWDAYGGNRYQTVTINDGSGPQTVQLSSSFVQGAWMHAPINVAPGGSVTVTATMTGGVNSVISGIFLGGGGPPPPPPPPPILPTVDIPGPQGTWVPNYGADGYVLANWDGNNTDLVSLPPGVTVALEKGARATWVSPTGDVRALTNPTGTERRSRTWYDISQMRLRVSFANAYTGTIHLYAVDWDAYGGNRYENVTIDDGSGPRTAQLSTSFTQGAWIHTPISVPAGGSVVVTVDKTGGYSAVLAGLFLGTPGPPPPPALPYEIPGVQGSWVGQYGSVGYVLANWNGNNTDLVSLPSGVTSTLEKGARATWASSTTDVRALVAPTGTERRSQTWYDYSQMRLRLTFANGYAGTLHLYAVDWDAYGGNRYENVTVDDGGGARVAQLTTSFVQGAWMHATVNVPAGGSVVITVDKTGGYSAVLSGVFLGGSSPPTIPSAPTNLAATPGNAQVALTWSAPVNDGGSPITGYTATASPGGATCSTTGALGCTVTGLTNGTAYSFIVRAANVVGPGPASTSVNATPVAPATVPGAPTNLAATPGNGGVALTWSAPASDGGSAIMGYTATASPGGATCSTTGALGCPVTGLSNGTAYTFTVRATNAVGQGPASSSVGATPRTVPGAPTGVAAAPGNGQLVVTWTAPASDGGSTITDYVATSSPGGAGCSTTGATVCTIGGLTNGTAYTVTVTAANTAGIGPASVPVSATPATVPSAPNGLVATRGNGQVSLTWSAPTSNGGSAVTGYTATASPGGATCAVGDTTFACVIGGLTNGTSYSFTVTATNAIGTGPESAPASATPATVPGAPTNLLATPGNAQVSLTWSAPASNGGSAVTGYTATASPGGSTCSVDGTTFACTIGGLTNGISYTVTVTATNAVGTGAPSAPASATPVASATAPGAPTNLAATPGNGQVALTWSAPASNGGSPITGYTATASPGGATCSTSGALTCTVAGLTNGTAYTFTVRATNAVGQGPASGSVAATPRTVPTAPRNLDAKTASPKGVRLTWLAPTSNGGAAITGYKIYRGTSSGTETWLIDLGVVTTFTDTGTTAGTRYYYRVVAVNAAGPGPQSNEANARAK